MKKFNTRIGTIVTWYDYIKSSKNLRTGLTSYNQSNTKLDGYSQRYIGVYLSHDNKIYISVAVNKKEDNSNWWKYIIENRIITMFNNGGNVGPDDKGCTMVPMAYKELVYKDYNAFSNLYGIIDPTSLDLALKSCARSNEERINKARTSLGQDPQEASPSK